MKVDSWLTVMEKMFNFPILVIDEVVPDDLEIAIWAGCGKSLEAFTHFSMLLEENHTSKMGLWFS